METDTIVIVSLSLPKEKIWGRLISLNAAGVTLQGIDLNSFDDWIRQVLDAEPHVTTVSTVFYPMHRVERIVVDEATGDLPSVAQRFEDRVGISLLDYLKMPRKVI